MSKIKCEDMDKGTLLLANGDILHYDCEGVNEYKGNPYTLELDECDQVVAIHIDKIRK